MAEKSKKLNEKKRRNEMMQEPGKDKLKIPSFDIGEYPQHQVYKIHQKSCRYSSGSYYKRNQ